MAGERILPGLLALAGFWNPGSSGWSGEDGMDGNLRKISALAQMKVKSKTTSLPVSPVNGDMYIVPAGDNANKIAIRDNGAWVYVTPVTGMRGFCNDTGKFIWFMGTAWVEEGSEKAGIVGLKVFRESQTYTRPANVLSAVAIGTGGGGGGEQSASATDSGAGGGGGRTRGGLFALEATEDIEIGIGGASDADGGTTSLGAKLICPGGKAGTGSGVAEVGSGGYDFGASRGSGNHSSVSVSGGTLHYRISGSGGTFWGPGETISRLGTGSAPSRNGNSPGAGGTGGLGGPALGGSGAAGILLLLELGFVP